MLALVPPLLKPIAVAFQVPVAMVPVVVMLLDPAHVLKAVFSTADKPTSLLETALHEGAAPLVPVPVCERKFFVVVVFGESKEVVSVLLW